MAKTKVEIEAERAELLRAARIRNYRVKRASNWSCTTCGVGPMGNVVVRTGDGEGDEAFAVRCRQHVGDLPLAPGQLANEINGDDDA